MEENNINKKLIKFIRIRLADLIPHKYKSKKIISIDNIDNKCNEKIEYDYINIYSDEEINNFIEVARNEVITLTNRDANKDPRWNGLVVDYAVIIALATKALIEKGREFTISDNSLAYSSPEISKVIMEQYKIEYDMFMRKINLVINY